jgi:hypothetical protein
MIQKMSEKIDLPYGCWTFVVFRELIKPSEFMYTIRELFNLGEDGLAISEEPYWPQGETKDELSKELNMMCEALDKPIYELVNDEVREVTQGRTGGRP